MLVYPITRRVNPKKSLKLKLFAVFAVVNCFFQNHHLSLVCTALF